MIHYESLTSDVVTSLAQRPYVRLEGGESLGNVELELVVEINGLVHAVLNKVRSGNIKNTISNLWQTGRLTSSISIGGIYVLSVYEGVVEAVKRTGKLDDEEMTLGISVKGNTVTFDFTQLDVRVMQSIDETIKKGNGVVLKLHPDLQAD